MQDRELRSLVSRSAEVDLARHSRLRAKLGPVPAASLHAMRDYGLNDREIARYFGVTPSTVCRLRRALPGTRGR